MKQESMDLDLFQDKEVFDSIHRLKLQFTGLLTEIANYYPQEKLLEIYPGSKGSKISMGNDLDRCPYQVLDIFRNFDKTNGHNIRILAWWGHGLYIFAHFGRRMSRGLLGKESFQPLLKQDYALTAASTPWDYRTIINNGAFRKISTMAEANQVLEKFGYLQWFKAVPISNAPEDLTQNLLEELETIFRINRI